MTPNFVRIAGLLLACAMAPAAAQTAAPVPPPLVADAGGQSTARPPKVWAPRLTGVPVQPAGSNSFLLAGTEYQKRALLVSFFADVAADRVSGDLARFPTDAVDPASDGVTYTLMLSNERDLLPAFDAYNDLADVRAAALVPAEIRTTVAPTPVVSAAGGGATAAAESLWPGDVDGNYRITLSDAIAILRAAVGEIGLPPLQAARADVNRDGRIDLPDVTLTLRLLVGQGLPAPYGFQ